MRVALAALVASGLILFGLAHASQSRADFIDCPALGVCSGTEFADDLNGTDGYDEIRGKEGPDNVNGYGSGDDLFGGAGADVIVGGGGDDAMHGKAGDDEMRAASDDSGGDFVDCGDGNDQAWVDPGDAVDPDCETVHYIF